MHSKLLSFVSFALLAWASPPIQVSLKTSWPAPPFLLELLETISLETPDSFAHLVDLVTNPNVLPNPDTLSPEALLHATLEIAGEAGFLSKHGSLAAVQMNLALHSATPRIQAMFDYFEHRGARPEGKCQEAWVDWYGQHVCDIESLVQLTGHETIDSANSLQTDPFERPKLLPLDHIYPSPDRLVHRPPRTAILYGSLTSPKFRELHTHLYGMASAELPHIEYVIRSIPPAKATSSPLFLSGYGVSLDLKKTDYLAVDDRLVRQDAKRGTSEEVVETTDLISELLEQFPEVESGIDLSAAPTSEELKDVGAKAVQLIMTSPQPFSVLKQLSQNFPKYASALVKRVAVNESIDLELQENAGLIGPGTNTLWLNGAQVEEKDMTPHGLSRLLNKERDAVLSLVGPDKLEDAGKAVQLLSDEKLGASLLTTPGLDGIFDASDRPESGDVIIWWNNIETEERYSKWATNLRSLLRPLFPGQFPQIKANMYNVVMVADLAKMSALNLIAGPMASIIERGYPFTFGFVPDLETEEGRALAHLVSYLVEKQGSKAALDFLKKISQVHVPPAHRSTTIDWDLVRRGFLKAAESTEGGDQIDFDAIMNGENSQLPVDKIAAYIRRLGATQEDSPVGHGFVNGKHLRLDDDFLRNFQMEVGQQIQHFQEQVHYGKLTDKNFSALSTYYYDLPSTSQRRNPYIFPTPSGPGRLRFANIPELTSRCTLRTESNIFLLPTLHSTTLAPVTVYVIADLDSRSGRHLVNEALLALSNQDSMVPFRLALLHNPEDVEEDDMPDRLPTSWYIAYLIHKGQMATTDPAQLMKAMDTFARAPSLGHAEDAFKDLTSGVTLASIDPAVHHRMLAEGRLVARKLELSPGEQGMIVNGRVIGPIDSGRFSADDLNTLVEYEYLRRTQPLMNALDEIDSSILAKDNSVVSSLLFEAGATISALQLADPSEVGLFDTPQRPRSRAYERLAQVYTGFRMGDNATAMYHLSVVINPLNVKAQKLISLVEWLSNVPNIYIEVRLNPRATNEMPLKQFYRYNVQSILTFDNTGAEISPAAVFEDLPTEPIYTLAMDVPPSWLVRPREALYDLDNIQLGQLAPEDKSLDATFQLDYLVVEGHARDVQSGAPPRGLQLELLDGDGAPIDDTLVVANLGYLQFKARPGVFTLDIRPGRGREVFSLESVGSEGWFSPPVSESGSDITVASFEGVTLYPRLSRNEGMEAVDVLEDTGEVEDSNLFQRVKSLFQSNPDAERQAEINIFTVASGLLYERFASIMILSVLRNTKHTVKFWFIENFLSPSFLEFIPHFAKEYKFDYELVTYKWPSWLRAQTEKQRIIWAYKILFLDVLFPMDLKKVIFVDADQIVRADLKELVDVDLQGAPYGYTPMGDDSYDMDGFRFWKTGYWKDFLGGLPYHISALYVVDLVRFRQMAAGDMLRGHYQQLSADPNSLANLDQDLPNNLQRQVPIFSLHEDWLWCETWCSKDRLHRAKTIDLCQNPLTKEPKLSRARQIPEWEHYDAEIWNFTKKLAEQGLIHSRVAAADTNILAGSKESKPEPESHATEESEVHHKPEVSSTDRQESQEFPKDEL